MLISLSDLHRRDVAVDIHTHLRQRLSETTTTTTTTSTTESRNIGLLGRLHQEHSPAAWFDSGYSSCVSSGNLLFSVCVA